MQFNIISPSRFKTVPWKNGQGSTKELLYEGIEGDNEFAWRLSMAPVTEDGLFSDFSGYDRHLILVEGNGITLKHNNGHTDKLGQRFDMAKFDGGWITEATLHQGEISDFNVMTRRGVCRSKIDIIGEMGEHKFAVDADQLLVYPLDNAVELVTPEPQTLQLEARNLLQVISPLKGVWKILGEALVCVQISYLLGNIK